MAFLVHDARPLERPTRPVGDIQPLGRRRLWRVDVLQALAVASVAIAVALFLADGGADRFGDAGAALTSLGVIAGLIATDLVLVMLLLAARAPFIERAVGHDAAMALHGRLGKPVLYLLLAHGVLLLAGYALADGVDLVAEAVAIWSLPDLPIAVLGLALFMLVVVSSLVAVRRRLRYEFWHVVHLLSYLAVLAALPHQFTDGLFAEGTWQRGYWLVFTIGTLATVVAFRFVAPLALTLRHRVRVESVEPVGAPEDGVVSVTLRGDGLDRLRVRGGPVLHLALPRPRPVVAGASVLALGRAARRPAAHHGPRARRRLGRARPTPARHAGRAGGPVRHLQRSLPHASTADPRGRRHRGHPDPLAARDGIVPSRRGDRRAPHARCGRRMAPR